MATELATQERGEIQCKDHQSSFVTSEKYMPCASPWRVPVPILSFASQIRKYRQAIRSIKRTLRLSLMWGLRQLSCLFRWHCWQVLAKGR